MKAKKKNPWNGANIQRSERDSEVGNPSISEELNTSVAAYLLNHRVSRPAKSNQCIIQVVPIGFPHENARSGHACVFNGQKLFFSPVKSFASTKHEECTDRYLTYDQRLNKTNGKFYLT